MFEHTSCDQLVPVRISDRYLGLVEQSGSQDRAAYVKHDGHGNILAPEIAAGFSELRAWKDRGVKPHAAFIWKPSWRGASSQGQRADR